MSGLELQSRCVFTFWKHTLLFFPLDFVISKIATRHGVERSYFPNEWGYYFVDYHSYEGKKDIISLQLPLDKDGNFIGSARLCDYSESQYFFHDDFHEHWARQIYESADEDIRSALPTISYPEVPSYSYMMMSDLYSAKAKMR